LEPASFFLLNLEGRHVLYLALYLCLYLTPAKGVETRS
jgi:hypothetical protein